MKKSVLALAALSALAGVAHAQSTVSLYGRVDLAYSKRSGYQNSGINDTQNSRIGFKGVEDLGGGLKALFNLEAGLSPDDGTQADSSAFFNRRAVVGLQSDDYGTLTLGREYSPTFLLTEKAADPWGTDGYASYEAVVRGGVGGTADKPSGAAILGGTATIDHYGATPYATGSLEASTGAIDQKRTNNSVTYNLSMSGFNFGAQYGAKENNGSSSPYRNRVSLATSYGAGPFYVGLGYDAPGTAQPQFSRAHWVSLVGTYDFGFLKAFGFYGTGRNAIANAEGDKVRSWLLGASAPLAAGELRVAYGELKNKTLSKNVIEQTSVGYYYPLSKRTTVYSDVTYDSKAGYGLDPVNGKSKTGYEFGIKHEF